MIHLGEPLVSIVIPAYNCERWIGPTLDSASNQTHRRLEIVVVDDGSTDGTADIVRAKAARDNRIRLIAQKSSGVAAARNRGLVEGRGSYFAPLDADDLWHPRKIELQVATFQRAGQDAALVYAWSSIIDEDGRIIGHAAQRRVEGKVLAELVAHNFISNASVPLIRIAAARAVGGYDEGLYRMNAQGCEDIKFHFAIAERWAIAMVSEILVGYRRTNDSMSMNVQRMHRSRALVLSDLRQRHPKIPAAAFRMSDQRFALWAATRCIQAGRNSEGYRLIAMAMHRDPLLPVRRYARPYVGQVLRSWENRLGLGRMLPPGRGEFFLPAGGSAAPPTDAGSGKALPETSFR